MEERWRGPLVLSVKPVLRSRNRNLSEASYREVSPAPSKPCSLPFALLLTEIAGEAGPTKNSLDFTQDLLDYCFPAPTHSL